MKKAAFIEFLLRANKSGYADTAAEITDFPDGGHEVVYTQGEFRFADYWYGGNPFAGQEAVAVAGKTIWAMQYRGGVPEKFSGRENEVFAFLKQALSQCSAEEPVRGPVEFTDGEWRYNNVWSRDISEFTGHEEITYKGEVAHTTDYVGGLVDGATWEE